MPIYEFRCSNCRDVFEILVTHNEEQVEMSCPRCLSGDIERVMSATNYSIGGIGKGAQVNAKTRTCSGGSCTTYTLPGHTR